MAMKTDLADYWPLLSAEGTQGAAAPLERQFPPHPRNLEGSSTEVEVTWESPGLSIKPLGSRPGLLSRLEPWCGNHL